MKRIAALIQAGVPFAFNGRRILYSHSGLLKAVPGKRSCGNVNIASLDNGAYGGLITAGNSNIDNGLEELRLFINNRKPELDKRLDARIRLFQQDFSSLCRAVNPPFTTTWDINANASNGYAVLTALFSWDDQDTLMLIETAFASGYREDHSQRIPELQSPNFRKNDYEFALAMHPEKGFIHARLALYCG